MKPLLMTDPKVRAWREENGLVLGAIVHNTQSDTSYTVIEIELDNDSVYLVEQLILADFVVRLRRMDHAGRILTGRLLTPNWRIIPDLLDDTISEKPAPVIAVIESFY